VVFFLILPHATGESRRKLTVGRLSKRSSLIIGQRMGAEKMLGLQKEDQALQSRLGRNVLGSGCMLVKSFPPILLPLAAEPFEPMAEGDLSQEAQKDGKPDHLKAPIIEVRSQGMNRSTIRTAIAPHIQRFRALIEIPPNIPMTPESLALASGTTRRTGPRILPSDLLQKLDIDLAVQYQGRSFAGVTEGSTPGREAPSVIPFLSPMQIVRGKKTYTTNGEILGRGLGRTM